MGIELTTPGLRDQCSAPELWRLLFADGSILKILTIHWKCVFFYNPCAIIETSLNRDCLFRRTRHYWNVVHRRQRLPVVFYELEVQVERDPCPRFDIAGDATKRVTSPLTVQLNLIQTFGECLFVCLSVCLSISLSVYFFFFFF